MFRSVRKKRKRIISVSVDDQVLDFLDKQANKSLFIRDLVRKSMEEQKPTEEQEPEPVEPQLSWTDEMKQLWQERARLVNKYGKRFEGGSGPESSVYVYGLEERWCYLNFGSSGYTGEEEEFNEEAKKFEPDVLDYFKKVLNLPRGPDSPLSLYLARMEEEKEARRQRNLRIQCGGDPEEVVWRNLTRWDIMHHFEKEKYYSVQGVAAELGISYDQAYKHIVPWLKAQGFRVG